MLQHLNIVLKVAIDIKLSHAWKVNGCLVLLFQGLVAKLE